jgi:hypothetical protein
MKHGLIAKFSRMKKGAGYGQPFLDVQEASFDTGLRSEE